MDKVMSLLPEESMRSRLEHYASVNGDSLIWSYLQAGRQNAEPIEETMEKIIHAQGQRNKKQFEMLMDLSSTSVAVRKFIP